MGRPRSEHPIAWQRERRLSVYMPSPEAVEDVRARARALGLRPSQYVAALVELHRLIEAAELERPRGRALLHAAGLGGP